MEEHGPFDDILQPEPPEQKRDRTAVAIVAVSIVLGFILLILVLPPVSILDNGKGGNSSSPDNISATKRDDMPAPPEAFEAVSALYDLAVTPASTRGARLTVNLSSDISATDELSLFTYQNNAWRRLGGATTVAGGESASGDVSALPPNVAVFRPASATTTGRAIMGTLPPGAELDSRAQGTLTVLNPTGLTPAADGQISGGPLQLPQGLTIPIVPTISASTPEQIDTINAILQSPDLRTAHVQAIVDLVTNGNFAGIDLDYRFDPSFQPEFSQFAQALSTALQGGSKTLTITMPVPVQQGTNWDTLGFDLNALAPLVEAFKLAPDPAQDTYYQRLDPALGYLTSRVGASKLVLAIDSLSRERGADGVRTLTLTDALSIAGTPSLANNSVAPGATVPLSDDVLAGQGGSGTLAWDDGAHAVTFSYTGPGGLRTVWLANLFSEAFRLDLADRYRLRGVAIEDASNGTQDANVWPVVAQYAQSGQVQLVRPNGDLLTPHWIATGGTLSTDAGAQVDWTAPPQAGTYTITLVVSDGILRIGQELSVPIAAAASP